MSALPTTAAWRHHEARDGFEVVFLREEDDGYLVEGHTAAVEDDVAWAVSYRIWLDHSWMTRRAVVSGQTAEAGHETVLESDGHGTWHVDGIHAEHLDGCLDVDLESSALTNAFPVRRLGLAVDERADAPAAYVRAIDLAVERLEQRYVRIEDAFDVENTEAPPTSATTTRRRPSTSVASSSTTRPASCSRTPASRYASDRPLRA